MPAAAQGSRKGYLISTSDTTTPTVTDIGHVFGRFGVGEDNTPDKAAPFYWGNPV